MIINEELGHNISGISDEEMLRQLVEKLKNNEKADFKGTAADKI